MIILGNHCIPNIFFTNVICIDFEPLKLRFYFEKTRSHF